MALFDELTKKAAKFTEEAIDKTQEVAGNAKTKLKIKNLETDRDDVYCELGKYYYNLIKEDTEGLIDEDISEKRESIKKLTEEIEELKSKLSDD